MTFASSVACLWSRTDPFGSMARNFRGEEARVDGYDIAVGLAFLAMLVVGALILSKMLSRQDRLQLCNNPRTLFKELCRAHGLKRPERQLLRRLALHHGLDEPILLFLAPERFQTNGLPTEWRHHCDAIRRLGVRLFGEDGQSPA